MAMALMGGLISGQFQVKLKANQDAGSITEAAVLKVNGARKFGIFIGRFAKFRKPERN